MKRFVGYDNHVSLLVEFKKGSEDRVITGIKGWDHHMPFNYIILSAINGDIIYSYKTSTGGIWD